MWNSRSGNREQGEGVADCYSLVILPFLSFAGVLLGSVVQPLPCDSVASPDGASDSQQGQYCHVGKMILHSPVPWALNTSHSCVVTL